MADATLILDCTECRDPARAHEDTRQEDGLREWTADFSITASTNAEGWCYWPVEGEEALRCPECGAKGRIWHY